MATLAGDVSGSALPGEEGRRTAWRRRQQRQRATARHVDWLFGLASAKRAHHTAPQARGAGTVEMEQVAELKSQLVGLEKQLQECVAQIAELTKQLADVDNQQKELHVRKGNFQHPVSKLQHPVEKQNGDEDLGEHTKLHSQGQATLAHGSGAPSIDSGEVDKAKKKQTIFSWRPSTRGPCFLS